MSADNKKLQLLSPRAKQLLTEIKQHELDKKKTALQSWWLGLERWFAFLKQKKRSSGEQIDEKAGEEAEKKGASVKKKKFSVASLFEKLNRSMTRLNLGLWLKAKKDKLAGSNKISLDKTKLLHTFEKWVKFFHPKNQKTKFNSTTYLSLSKSSRLPVWSGMIGALVLVFILLAYNFTQLFTSQDRIKKMRDAIPILEKEIKQLEPKIHKREILLEQFDTQINKKLSGFMSATEVKSIISPIVATFEKKNLTIIGQDVAFNQMPSAADLVKPSLKKPSADSTLFSTAKKAEAADDPSLVESVKAAVKPSKKKSKKGDAKKAAEPAKIAPPSAEERARVEKIASLKQSIPSDLNFMRVTFYLRGEYLNYLRARNILVGYLPSLTIPLEEIAMNPKNGAIEYHVIYEVPYLVRPIPTPTPNLPAANLTEPAAKNDRLSTNATAAVAEPKLIIAAAVHQKITKPISKEKNYRKKI